MRSGVLRFSRAVWDQDGEREGLEEQAMRVVIANDLESYRDAISSALEALRPGMEVLNVRPEMLDSELSRSLPNVVIVSRRTALIEREVFAWIELYENHGPNVTVSLAGERKVYPNMDFETLLWTLDEAERLYASV